MGDFEYPTVELQTSPDRYVHWDLKFEGPVATLVMHIKEDRPMWAGRYELKLNSYDLGVDIELNDAVMRLRFEHPEVKTVVVTGAYDKVFSAGANIRMLGMAPHAFKVNFCKYTNETRVGIEDATESSGQHYIAALNGTASGGGYELALACKEIVLIDDGNAAVSLPEVPLLGVLPGTGGLTRLTDKRRIRRDMADVFCTKAEGFRARDAKKFRFVDDTYARSRWEGSVKALAAKRATEMAAKFPLRHGPGVTLPPITRTATKGGWRYSTVSVGIDGRVASLRIEGPTSAPARSADSWLFRCFRELEDALLDLRINHLDVGLILLESSGEAAAVLEHERFLVEGARSDWFLAECQNFVARTLRRFDNTSKSLFAIVKPGHCFAGVLFELVLAADRSFMLADEDGQNTLSLSGAQAGAFPMATGTTRLKLRYPGDDKAVAAVLEAAEEGPITGEGADELGLVTAAPDDIDWDDEVRIAVEERISLSPDALTGMEQNLRFGGAESAETKIYGRLSAWQNWIFQRPNAVGEHGALSLFGHPERPVFDYRRT